MRDTQVRSRRTIWLIRFSFIYVALVVIFGVWSVFLPASTIDSDGCFWTDRMVFVVDCNGNWIYQI